MFKQKKFPFKGTVSQDDAFLLKDCKVKHLFSVCALAMFRIADWLIVVILKFRLVKLALMFLLIKSKNPYHTETFFIIFPRPLVDFLKWPSLIGCVKMLAKKSAKMAHIVCGFLRFFSR
jgi:hypothetical protein